YYKLTINGATVIEIDLVNMTEIVNGVDLLAAQRRAIGA
ncbi:phage major tail tube protein, partial [Xanthomonas vasicola]